MSRIYTVAILLAITTLSSATVDSRYVKCPTENRPQFCDTMYKPVCGIPFPNQIQCLVAPCVFDHSNSCNACADANIEFYVDGVCKSQEFDRFYCEEKQRNAEVCTLEYIETCGFNSSGPVSQYSNRCHACAEPQVEYIQFSVCPDTQPINMQQFKCEPKERNAQACTMEYIQTCGYQQGGSSHSSYGNRCTACSDPQVEYIVFDKCPDSATEISICDDKQRNNQICTTEYSPICGLQNDGTFINTYSNRCEACQNKEVVSVMVGTCPPISSPQFTNECQAEQRNVDFCTEEYSPICGYFTEGDIQYKTFSNRCYACKEQTVGKINLGDCNIMESQGNNEGTKDPYEPCGDLRYQVRCSQELIPTCAKLQKCVSGVCEMTYTNRCMACSDSSVTATLEGECDGRMYKGAAQTPDQKEEISLAQNYCEPLVASGECSNFDKSVCAFQSECSNLDTCYTQQPNGCSACKEAKANFFIQGECVVKTQTLMNNDSNIFLISPLLILLMASFFAY